MTRQMIRQKKHTMPWQKRRKKTRLFK
jgi:hypothetical protein